MQIILIDKVSNLGNFGDRVNVKAGYVRNFLIPNRKAVLATKKNIEYFKVRCNELNARLAETLAIAESRAERIKALGSVVIKSKAGNEGKLFGSIGTRDIVDAVTAAGIKINKNEVRLPNGAFRAIGSYEVKLQLHSEVSAQITIEIIPDKI